MAYDVEMEQFKADLLTSARELKSGKVARSTVVSIPEVVNVRRNAGLSQSEFSRLLGVSVRTLQGWEQGRINLLVRLKHCCLLHLSILRCCESYLLRNP